MMRRDHPGAASIAHSTEHRVILPFCLPFRLLFLLSHRYKPLLYRLEANLSANKSPTVPPLLHRLHRLCKYTDDGSAVHAQTYRLLRTQAMIGSRLSRTPALPRRRCVTLILCNPYPHHLSNGSSFCRGCGRCEMTTIWQFASSAPMPCLDAVPRRCATLCYTVLCCAMLCYAVPCSAVLCRAVPAVPSSCCAIQPPVERPDTKSQPILPPSPCKEGTTRPSRLYHGD